MREAVGRKEALLQAKLDAIEINEGRLLVPRAQNADVLQENSPPPRAKHQITSLEAKPAHLGYEKRMEVVRSAAHGQAEARAIQLHTSAICRFLDSPSKAGKLMQTPAFSSLPAAQKGRLAGAQGRVEAEALGQSLADGQQAVSIRGLLRWLRGDGAFERFIEALAHDSVKSGDLALALEESAKEELKNLQRQRLVAFYESTGGGEDWQKTDHWLNVNEPLDEWYGTGVLEGEITALRLASNGLTGSLPPSLGTFYMLQELHVSGNRLGGAIPESIGELSMLESLLLQNNQLQGQIPASIGRCKKLVYFSARNNRLSGMIPDALLRCDALEELYLHDNPDLEERDEFERAAKDWFKDQLILMV